MSSIAPNTTQVRELGHWSEFAARVRTGELAGRRLFRGQRDADWPLASPWERWLAAHREPGDRRSDVAATLGRETLLALRDAYLGRFREQCLGLPNFDSADLDDHDWWALGRHYGLTTPLLDWSTSPYVAAFFAYLDHADELNPGFSHGTHQGAFRCGEGRVAVWQLTITPQIEGLEELEILLPKLDRTHRRRAQGGYFTRLTHTVHLDLQSYLSACGLAHCLCLYALPARDVRTALRDLYLMDIHPAKLFPDFTGAAAMANLLPHLL